MPFLAGACSLALKRHLGSHFASLRHIAWLSYGGWLVAFPSPLPLAATRSPVTGWVQWAAPATSLMASHPRITPGACTRWGRTRRMARLDWIPTLIYGDFSSHSQL